VFRDIKEIINTSYVDFEKCIYWEKINEAILLSESMIIHYPWSDVTALYFLGTIGRNDYTAQSHGFKRVFGVANYNEKQVCIVGADNNIINMVLSLCSENLKELTVMFTDNVEIDLQGHVGIEGISVEHNTNMRLHNLSNLGRMKNIYIRNADIGLQIDLCWWKELFRLILDNVSINRILVNENMNTIKNMFLYNLGITHYDFLERFPNLERLGLKGENVTDLDNVILPSGIKDLRLYNVKIRHLPESLRNLYQIKKLDLWNLQLETLPDWIPELGLSFHSGDKIIGMGGTCVADMDMSLFKQLCLIMSYIG